MATPLKAARAATGWSQPQVIARMRQVAASLGEDLPGAHTMRCQLCRWENGRQRPGEFYQRIFCMVYHLSPQQLGFPSPPNGASTGAVGVEVMTALLYAAPLTQAELRTVAPARVRLYTEVALADPRTPSPTELVAGLHRARVEEPAWLDRTRLQICEHAAHQAQATTLPVLVEGRVPDWVTTGRLVGSGIAAAVFTTPG